MIAPEPVSPSLLAGMKPRSYGLQIRSCDCTCRERLKRPKTQIHCLTRRWKAFLQTHPLLAFPNFTFLCTPYLHWPSWDTGPPTMVFKAEPIRTRIHFKRPSRRSTFWSLFSKSRVPIPFISKKARSRERGVYPQSHRRR